MCNLIGNHLIHGTISWTHKEPLHKSKQCGQCGLYDIFRLSCSLVITSHLFFRAEENLTQSNLFQISPQPIRNQSRPHYWVAGNLLSIDFVSLSVDVSIIGQTSKPLHHRPGKHFLPRWCKLLHLIQPSDCPIRLP